MVIKYSKDSLKFLSKLDKKSVARIRAAIQDLTLTPPKGDIKVMQGTMMTGNGSELARGASFISMVLIMRSTFYSLLTSETEETSTSKEVVFMSDMAIDAARMMDMLPDEDKNFAYEFIKKLVKAWDPDFTKVTPEEAQRIKAAEESGFVADSDIDWDHLSAIV